MFGLYEQPLQARPSLIFPFLPFFCPPVLSPAWMGWLSPIPFRRCPGFAHNWPTRLQQGWSGASLVSFLYPVLKLAKNRRTRASLDFLPRTSLPLPLKGEGPGIVCLGFVGFAPLGHSCLTRLQQGRFGGWLVFAPYSASKTAHRATQALVWFSPFFPPAFLLRQSRQILLQLVIHRLLDGANRVKKIPISHQACLCFYLRGLRVDQSLLFQLPYVFCNRVSAHACMLANASDAGPALVRFSILAENQVGIERHLTRAKPQGKNGIRKEKKSSVLQPFRICVFDFRTANLHPLFESSRLFAVYFCKRFSKFALQSPFLCLLSRKF